eukprot:g10255.t1
MQAYGGPRHWPMTTATAGHAWWSDLSNPLKKTVGWTTHIGSGSCFHIGRKHPQGQGGWWGMKFKDGQKHYVAAMELWNRGHCCANRIDNACVILIEDANYTPGDLEYQFDQGKIDGVGGCDMRLPSGASRVTSDYNSGSIFEINKEIYGVIITSSLSPKRHWFTLCGAKFYKGRSRVSLFSPGDLLAAQDSDKTDLSPNTASSPFEFSPGGPTTWKNFNTATETGTDPWWRLTFPNDATEFVSVLKMWSVQGGHHNECGDFFNNCAGHHWFQRPCSKRISFAPVFFNESPTPDMYLPGISHLGTVQHEYASDEMQELPNLLEITARAVADGSNLIQPYAGAHNVFRAAAKAVDASEPSYGFGEKNLADNSKYETDYKCDPDYDALPEIQQKCIQLEGDCKFIFDYDNDGRNWRVCNGTYGGPGASDGAIMYKVELQGPYVDEKYNTTEELVLNAWSLSNIDAAKIDYTTFDSLQVESTENGKQTRKLADAKFSEAELTGLAADGSPLLAAAESSYYMGFDPANGDPNRVGGFALDRMVRGTTGFMSAVSFGPDKCPWLEVDLGDDAQAQAVGVVQLYLDTEECNGCTRTAALRRLFVEDTAFLPDQPHSDWPTDLLTSSGFRVGIHGGGSWKDTATTAAGINGDWCQSGSPTADVAVCEHVLYDGGWERLVEVEPNAVTKITVDCRGNQGRFLFVELPSPTGQNRVLQLQEVRAFKPYAPLRVCSPAFDQCLAPGTADVPETTQGSTLTSLDACVEQCRRFAQCRAVCWTEATKTCDLKTATKQTDAALVQAAGVVYAEPCDMGHVHRACRGLNNHAWYGGNTAAETDAVGGISRIFESDITKVEITYGVCRLDGCNDDVNGCEYPAGAKFLLDGTEQEVENPLYDSTAGSDDGPKAMPKVFTVYANEGDSSVVTHSVLNPGGKNITIEEVGNTSLRIEKVRMFKEATDVQYEYAQLAAGETCADASQVLKTAESCQLALVSLGIPYDNSKWWKSDDLGNPSMPNGCSVPKDELDESVFMNYYTGVGFADDDKRPICIRPRPVSTQTYTFKFGKKGEVCKSEDLVIATKEECTKALQQLNRAPQSWLTYATDSPDAGQARFNYKIGVGDKNEDVVPVCKHFKGSGQERQLLGVELQASQSSTEGAYVGSFPLFYAGEPTAVEEGTCSITKATSGDEQPWWEAEVKEGVVFISRIVLYNGETGQEELDGASLSVDGAEYELPKEISTYGTEVIVDRTASKVRITGNPASRLKLCGIRIFMHASERKLAAGELEATQIDIEQGRNATFPLHFLHGTTKYPGTCAFTKTSTDAWWQARIKPTAGSVAVDKKFVTRVVVWGASDQYQDSLEDATLVIDDDVRLPFPSAISSDPDEGTDLAVDFGAETLRIETKNAVMLCGIEIYVKKESDFGNAAATAATRKQLMLKAQEKALQKLEELQKATDQYNAQIQVANAQADEAEKAYIGANLTLADNLEKAETYQKEADQAKVKPPAKQSADVVEAAKMNVLAINAAQVQQINALSRTKDELLDKIDVLNLQLEGAEKVEDMFEDHYKMRKEEMAVKEDGAQTELNQHITAEETTKSNAAAAAAQAEQSEKDASAETAEVEEKMNAHIQEQAEISEKTTLEAETKVQASQENLEKVQANTTAIELEHTNYIAALKQNETDAKLERKTIEEAEKLHKKNTNLQLKFNEETQKVMDKAQRVAVLKHHEQKMKMENNTANARIHFSQTKISEYQATAADWKQQRLDAEATAEQRRLEEEKAKEDLAEETGEDPRLING